MPIRRLSVDLQRKAERELNELPGRVEEDLKHLKEWLSKQPHLKVRTEDQWLLSFLRGCRFSLEQTKKKIDLFYTMRTLIPEFFGNRDPFQPSIQEILNGKMVVLLPETSDAAGPRITVIRVKAADPDKVDLVTVMKVTSMVADILMMEDDNCVISGQLVLVDLQDLPYKYVVQLSPSLLKKSACLQSAYPIRHRGFYFINTPSIFETVYNTIKEVVPEELANAAKFCSDFESIYKAIPQSILPTEYGGDGGTIESISNKWKLKIESYRDWFLEDTAYCSDETKRPGQPKTSANMFGVQGSFRKLDVD